MDHYIYLCNSLHLGESLCFEELKSALRVCVVYGRTELESNHKGREDVDEWTVKVTLDQGQGKGDTARIMCSRNEGWSRMTGMKGFSGEVADSDRMRVKTDAGVTGPTEWCLLVISLDLM